jgi:cell division protein ZapA (FtsZ GTPase activity inhibitor)
VVENLINIELFGQTYTFKTETEETAAKAVAERLVEEVNRIQEIELRQHPELSKLTVMILAALNFVKENNEIKERYVVFQRQVAERSDMLLRRIDCDLNIML